MNDRLVWTDWPEALARKVMAEVVVAPDPVQLASLEVKGQAAPLPFYKHWQLVVLHSTHHGLESGPPTEMEDVYALWRDADEPLLLDGTSAPIYVANDDESLQLTTEGTPDYIRFFCFAVRADDEAFILYEEPIENTEADPETKQAARPLTPKGSDADGNRLFEATVVYAGTAFRAVFSVPPNGAVTMVEDEPLAVTLPAAVIRTLPSLGLGPILSGYLAQTSPAAAVAPARKVRGKRASSARPKRATAAASDQPAVVLMVELLLERALLEQAKSRLLEYFNATLPSAKPLEQFAALMLDTSPVVIIETSMPFVEETIGQIVNERVQPPGQLYICGPEVTGDNMQLEYGLPNQGPAIVLIPLQIYRSVARVERVAFDIAARDLAAIITCERVSQLPESLRRIRDVVLRLPALDPASFETLFTRVIGHAPPVGWQAGGSEWVKHLLPTDFEHPRRMRLSREKAFEFVRSEVADRLSDVDPVQGLGLSDLYGLGEARQFAEDLIADIHAAMLGQLPWSQVDRGALLVGAPGTGKTTLARAIAKDCGVRFISASAASWQAMGESLGPHISAIRRTFSEARNYAPSILFIDEIDSIGNREEFAGTNNSIYQTEVVNAVLEEMAGLDPAAPVFVIGATNHEERVDPALRRSGRLDRIIQIPRPNSAALDHIYRYYIDALGTGTPLDPALDTMALARLSVGLTGADVERIVRGAARRARKANRAMSQIDVLAEITDKPRGADAYLILTPAELARTATHEAGHAFALFLGESKGSDIGFVSIVPRDEGVLGFVYPLSDERVHLTRRDLEAKLDAFLAGRAAEELIYGSEQVSGGAERDLQFATELVTRMVTKLGLGESRRLLWSETVSAADLTLAETTLSQSYERVLNKLEKYKARLGTLAQALVDRQELTGDEVRALLSGR
jgi:AAA+ superfamily predicted ATPase